MVIHSQVLNCTASEVAAMIEGAIHHGTELDVKANYIDTHGQSVIGFGLTRLLGVRPAAEDQADQPGPALPPGPRARRSRAWRRRWWAGRSGGT